jgi:23S rRNA (uracil747-C5)-methyltransferase
LIVAANDRDQLMVQFVMRSTADLARIKSKLPSLLAQLPNLEVVSVNVHPEHSAVLHGNREIVLTKNSTLTMPVGDVELQLGSLSFFQTNTSVAGLLYQTATAWVSELRDIQSIWDLYCGVGGFALSLAGTGTQVTGIEVTPEAIDNAKAAARELGLAASTRFLADDATQFALNSTEPVPDVVVVNPPRRGIGETLTGWLNSSGARYILYSSCNPVTLVKDLTKLANYRVAKAQLFDMFPNTEHAEVLTLFEKVCH